MTTTRTTTTGDGVAAPATNGAAPATNGAAPATNGEAPSAPSGADTPQAAAGPASPRPADTLRISGELAGRLMRSSRWQQ